MTQTWTSQNVIVEKTGEYMTAYMLLHHHTDMKLFVMGTGDEHGKNIPDSIERRKLYRINTKTNLVNIYYPSEEYMLIDNRQVWKTKTPEEYDVWLMERLQKGLQKKGRSLGPDYHRPHTTITAFDSLRYKLKA